MRISFSAVLTIALFFSACRQIPKIPPPAPTTFTIEEPNDYACYLNTAGTGRKINLLINLVVKVSRPTTTSSDWLLFDEHTITFDAASQSFPINVNAMIPSEIHAWRVEVNMQGLECSPCANGFSDQREPTGPCLSIPISPGQYQAAKPRWLGGYSSANYSNAITIGRAERIYNLPNSCNCTTP